jgi:phage gp36-like protein
MQFEEFLSVLDLLKNPAKYEAQVAELQARNDAIQESIKQLGVVGDVAKAKAAAEKLKDKAQAALDKASAEAEAILTTARSAYDKRHEELKAKEVVADQAIANYNTIKNQHAARENELRQQEKAAAALQEALAKQQADLAVKQAEVDERLTKLRQVMG